MFYYISFLRPPPLQASTDPILITPQISNDLRTEFLDDPIDIFYAWSLASPPPTTPVTTKPTKLTSWRPSTAYKEIPVPRPPAQHTLGTRDAASAPAWRLILTCGTTPGDQVVLLGVPNTTGRVPCAVMSMPVLFVSPGRHRDANTGAAANKRAGAKQERIVRSYALRVPACDRPIVFEITEQTSFDLDKKIWDSGIGLSSWLVHLFSGHASGLVDLHDTLFSTDARQILELGAGTGVVAITLAILRATLDQLDDAGSIVTTDLRAYVFTQLYTHPYTIVPLAPAIPILQDNIAASNDQYAGRCIPQAAVLDWEDDELPPQIQDQLEAGLDAIIMADVTYNTASFPALIETLSRLIQRSRKGQPRVLMGYKERHSDERSLWDCAKAIGLHFQQIAQVDGAGGNPVEIWLG